MSSPVKSPAPTESAPKSQDFDLPWLGYLPQGDLVYDRALDRRDREREWARDERGES